MMNLKQYYLLKLIEECTEVAQRAAKCMQFGTEQTQAKDGVELSSQDMSTRSKEQFLTNRERLSGELNDLLSVAIVLEDMGELDADVFLSETGKESKIKKMKKYLKYSRKLGLVGK